MTIHPPKPKQTSIEVEILGLSQRVQEGDALASARLMHLEKHYPDLWEDGKLIEDGTTNMLFTRLDTRPKPADE